MNISTGGPHILLFERDQQLTGLLISEFQLAGYECHTARTAVEVFDAIARQPIRLVLVNLSQAAAARREFWVALDTQRRGRGVQVLTFRCSNIANYGPKDPDEHMPTMVDLEIDGMTGIMNLVDAVRARVPVGGENAAPPAQRTTRSTSGQANGQRAASQMPRGNVSFANGGSGARPQENTPTLLSDYNSQNSQMPSFNELMAGEAQGRAPFTGQSMGNGGSILSQPTYPQGNPGAGNISPQSFYAQNAINPNAIPAQQSPYAQNPINLGGSAAQPSPYIQNGSNAGTMPAQASPYRQNTANPGNMATQVPSYGQKTNSAAAMPAQASPYIQNMSTGTVPAQASPYIQNTGNTGTIPAQASPYIQNPNGAGAIPAQASPYLQNPGSSQSQPSYTEKIRAVLYPNQRTWSQQGNAPSTFMPENRSPYEAQVSPPTPQPAPQPVQQPAPASDQTASTVLQRLASGQTGSEGPWESGLAQLSRMVQESSNPMLENTSNTPAYHIPKTPPAQEPSVEEQLFGQFFQSSSPKPQEVVQPEPRSESINTSTLRASPIQGLPAERSTGNPAGSEGGRRPDVHSRTNHAQQPAAPLASLSAATQVEGERRKEQEKTERTDIEESQTQIPVVRTTAEAAIRTTKGRAPGETARPIKARVIPEPPAPVPGEPIQELPIVPAKGIQDNMPVQTVTIQEMVQPAIHRIYPTEESSIQPRAKGGTQIALDEDIPLPEQNIEQEIIEANNYTETDSNKRLLEKAQEEIKAALGQHTSFDTSNAPSSALLLDIMQSLPPMPAPPQQVQPQVLNGRATRSLGSVLLEGHLVPQSRLEVAQNVQRMLRGVDLNYQLGEILLMFKLLTPDQLLAASLVSYGLITTTQISALGRIRQELHSIGLEYDLENLLIMFRILTPEQLREVRASWQ